MLLAVPNFSEGCSEAVIGKIEAALTGPAGVSLLDRHIDCDHNRSVFSLVGESAKLIDSLVAAAQVARANIDLAAHVGVHPRVGVLDVAPIVYYQPCDHHTATATALTLARRIGYELEIPVFLYGELSGGRSRAELRRGGAERLAQRVASGELIPDCGPDRLDPHVGAVLVTARQPLIAFNLELSPPATIADAQSIAADIRSGGPNGLKSVRAIGVELKSRGAVQVSTNIEDFHSTSPGAVVAAVAKHADVAAAEVVGLIPKEALSDFPADIELRNFAPQRQILENALQNAER